MVESWINESAPNTDRARLFSLYTIVDLFAVTGAQFLMPVFGTQGFELFALMAMFFALSLVPISLTDWSRPSLPAEFTFNIVKVWQISPLACSGVFAIGLTNSAFRLIGPLYGQAMGLDVKGIALFMSVGHPWRCRDAIPTRLFVRPH